MTYTPRLVIYRTIQNSFIQRSISQKNKQTYIQNCIQYNRQNQNKQQYQNHNKTITRQYNSSVFSSPEFGSPGGGGGNGPNNSNPFISAILSSALCVYISGKCGGDSPPSPPYNNHYFIQHL